MISFSCPMQVERALKLVSSGTITIEMVRKAKGRIPTLPKQINQATGKASNQLTGFNELAWGARCANYVKSAKKYQLLDSTRSSRFRQSTQRSTTILMTRTPLRSRMTMMISVPTSLIVPQALVAKIDCTLCLPWSSAD